MHRPKILVTEATGRTGHVLVTELVKAGYSVRATDGVQRAYWLPPYGPEMLTGAAVFATAAPPSRLR